MQKQSGQLQRRLGVTSAISITVGAVIGSGIFATPLKVSQSLPGEAWIYLLWIGLGLVCLFGAFAYAELGAMFPEAGGQYAFLREGWGRAVSFLYGWTFFWAINSGTMAALAVIFAESALKTFGISEADLAAERSPVLLLAGGMLLLLATVNHFGVVLGALLQNLSTFAKLLALFLIVLGGVMVASGGGAPSATTVVTAAPALTMSGLVAAFIAIFWTFEGWYQLPFNAAELKAPERNLPIGLIGGMVILIVTYAAVNMVYLHVIPLSEMRSFGTDKFEVPAQTVARIFSPEVAGYLTLLIAMSVLGAANPNLLSSPRAFYAMGKDGLVPQVMTYIHPRHGTPTVSIWIQAIWAVLLIIVLETFHDITAFVVFAAFLFYALTVAAVYRLRRTRPDLPRPYRCTGYPLTPLLFIVVSIAFVGALLMDPDEQKNALVGLVILALGGLVYAVHPGRRRRRAT